MEDEDKIAFPDNFEFKIPKDVEDRGFRKNEPVFFVVL